jgi:hypothetical protein
MQNLSWMCKSICYLLKQLLKKSSTLDITYTFEYLLTLIFKFDYPMVYYDLILTNLESIFEIKKIWKDQIFRRMFLELLDRLVKGLIRILGLCGQSDDGNSSK